MELINVMKKVYSKKGQAINATAVLSLIIVMAVATVLIILTSVLSAKTYLVVEDDLSLLTGTIGTSVNESIEAGFVAQQTNAEFLPVINIAFVLAIVIGVIFSVLAIASLGGGRGQGGVL